ncbi:MAG: TetR/AcrR family transcriptional regulator, partial [Anaerolineae bacterium]
IAERAGVSVGSVYQYFPNKDAILIALARQHIDEAQQRLGALIVQVRRSPQPVAVILRRLVDAVVAEHDEDEALHRAMFRRTPPSAALQQQLREVDAALVSQVAELLEAMPQVQVADRQCAAYLAVQTVDLLVHGYLLDPPAQPSREAFLAGLVDMLTAYLTAAPGDAVP